MYHRIYQAVYVLLFVVLVSLGYGCSTGKTGSCTINNDCEKGQRCLQQTCRVINIVNEKPVARIDAPANGRVNVSLTLEGGKSSDPEGGELTYQWSVKDAPSGSKAEIQDATKATATFVPDVGGRFTIQLIVKDDKDEESLPETATINVLGKSQNGAPIADAGPDRLSGTGSKVELDGSASSDPDGDKLTFLWSIKIKPDGSQVSLSDATLEKSPVTFDKVGKYVFELVVNDGIESSPPDSLTIEIIDDYDLEPSAEKLSPASGTIDTTPEVTITGKGFSSRAVVLFNGIVVPVDTVTFKSSTELLVKLKLLGITARSYPVIVRNPNGKETKPLSFEIIDSPVPTLASMTPTTGLTGSKIPLTLTGTGFGTSSKVLFNFVPLVTTFKNDTTLEVELDLTQTPIGDYEVKVQNPGGKSSAGLTFKVVSDGGFSPVLRVLNPSVGTVGTNIPFSVHGSSFSPGAVIVFDGKPIASIRQSRDTIESDPSLDLTSIAVGKYEVWVRNPDGKDSNKETFEVIEKDPAPKLDRILPPSAFLNDVNKLDVYGNYFDPKVKLFIGTTEFSGAAIQSLSTTYFTITLDTTKGTWTAGNIAAYVVNPNGKKSNTFMLTLNKKPTVPPPNIKRVSPTSGDSGKTITSFYIYGDNLCPNNGSTCSTYPKIMITDSAGVDWQAKSNILTSITSNLSSSSPHIRGRLNLTGLPGDTFKIQVEHPTTKTKSNTVSFTVRPPPGIRIDRLSPTSGDVGVDISDFRIYGDYFCPGTTKCTTLPKIYIKDANGVDLQATKSIYQVSSTSLGSSSSYIRGVLSVSKMLKGTYTFQIEHPTTQKQSAIKSFVVSTPKPLSLDYVYPYYAAIGSVVKCDLNGGPFTASTYVLIGTDKIPLLSGTSTTRRSFNFDVKTKYTISKNYDIKICNSPTVCSNIFAYPVMPATGTVPFITAVKGPSYPLVVNTTIDLSVYGYRWVDATTAKFFIDGKEVNTTNFTYTSKTCKQASSATSSSNCLFKGFNTRGLTAGKHSMQIKETAASSIPYDFYLQTP